MPSAFTIYGEIKADASGLTRTVQDADAKLRGLTQELDKTITKSNQLGDSSATVARRYDKLNDGIKVNSARITEATKAYAAGDITLKQFASQMAAVDRATDSLSSRLKDAKARATELAETNFTHFQNQLRGGVTDQQHSLINLNAARPLQGLGPVIQGLGLRQYGLDETLVNILIVAARQAGILKVAQEGTAVASQATAVATTAAAAAETELTTAAVAAKIAQTEVAAATQATAVAAAETVTIFGLGLGPLIAIGAVLAAAVSTILLAKKASEELLNVGKERLKTEEGVTASINEQYLSIVKLKKELADDQSTRDFGRFLKNAGSFEIASAQTDLQAQFEANAKAVVDEKNRRASAADDVGLKGQAKVDYVNAAVPQGFADSQKALQDQIKALGERRDEQKQSQSQSSEDFIKDIQGRQIEAFKQGIKQQSDAAKEAAEAAKKLTEAHKRAAEAAQREAEKRERLISDLTKQDAGRFDRSLDAYKLRREAQEFDQGFKFGPQSVGDKLQRQLDALGASFGTREVFNGYAEGGSQGRSVLSRTIANLTNLTDAQKDAYYKDVVKVTDGLQPEQLNDSQRQLASQARRFLADEEDKETKKIFTDLSNAIKQGHIVHIVNDAPDKAKVETRPSSADTESYYSNNQ